MLGYRGLTVAEKTEGESIWEERRWWRGPLLQLAGAVALFVASLLPGDLVRTLWVPGWGLESLRRAALALVLAYPILWLVARVRWKVSRIGLCSLWGWIVAVSAFAYWRFTGLRPPAIPFLAALAAGLAFFFSIGGASDGRQPQEAPDSGDMSPPSAAGATLVQEAAGWLDAAATGPDFLRWGPVRIIGGVVAAALLLGLVPASFAALVSCAFTLALALAACAWLVVWLCAARARKAEPMSLAFLFVLYLAASEPLVGWLRLARAVPLFDLPIRVATLIDAAAAIALAGVNAIWGRKWRRDAQLASAEPQES